MAMDEKLEAVLEQGIKNKCVEYFRDMPEKQRLALAPQCLKWLKHHSKTFTIEGPPGRFSVNQKIFAVEMAVLASASLTDVKKRVRFLHYSEDVAFDLLANRRPDWIDAWIESLLDDRRYAGRWVFIRRLIRAGLAKKQSHPNYYAGMITGLRERLEKESVYKKLQDDIELLDDEIWRLFEFDGTAENCLAGCDSASHKDGWTQALLKFSRDGRISRTRLLDSSLDALARDFNHYRAKWFAGLYDALEPTDKELAKHADRFLELLRVSAPNIVAWSFEKVVEQSKQNRYSPEQLIPALSPIFQAKSKGIVVQALKLLADVATKSPAASFDVALAATRGLAHEQADAQAAALGVLEKHGDRTNQKLQAAVRAASSHIAAANKKRLAAWLESPNATAEKTTAKTAPKQAASKGKPAAAKTTKHAKASAKIDEPMRRLLGIDQLEANLESGKLQIPAAIFDGTDIPRLAKLERVTPITDFDELIEVCSRVVEDETLVDDAERCFDGLSRLCASKPKDFEKRIAPLLKRVWHWLSTETPPLAGDSPRADLCALIHAWGTGKILRPVLKAGQLRFPDILERLHVSADNLLKALGFLSQRSVAIAERIVAGKDETLLSAPTHIGGWIEPRELVRRANAWSGGEPDVTDICLALLRLAPDGRAAALKELKGTKHEWNLALQYALGAEGVRVGKTAAIWVAAARSRMPWETDKQVEKAFPGLGPDAGTAATYEFKLRLNEFKHARLTLTTSPPTNKKPDTRLPTVMLHSQRLFHDGFFHDSCGESVGAIRWTATVWPVARDSFFASGFSDFVDNVDWWEACWHNKSLLEPLLDSGTPLRRMGLMLLVTGLACKEPGESGLATDIAIRAIEDGRLGSDNLGSALAELLPTGLIKPGRWQKTLGDVARSSPVHAAVVQIALQACLRGKPDKLPKDFGKLLELLLELSLELEQPLTDAACRECLTAIGRSGKSGKLATQLLQLPPDADESRVGDILRQAIELRVAQQSAE